MAKKSAGTGKKGITEGNASFPSHVKGAATRAAGKATGGLGKHSGQARPSPEPGAAGTKKLVEPRPGSKKPGSE